MKKFYILAALLMATTSAHAGGITLQINGERIRVEAPRNCNALSCIKITAPGYNGTLGNIDLKGLGSKSKDDDVADTAPAKPAPAPAPVQATAPAPPHPSQRQPRSRPDDRCIHRAGAIRRRAARPASGARHGRRARARSRRRLPQQPRPTRPRRSASGPPRTTRATFASRNAAPISAAMPSTAKRS